MRLHPRFGEIPAEWPVGRFGRYVEFRSGQVDPEDESFTNHILIAPNHIESGTGRLLSTETAADQGAESGKYWCDKGDVIYSKIRPALRKVTLAPFDCLCSADMYPLKGINGLLNRYLKWFLLSEPFSDFAAQESARVAMPKLNRETLAEAAVPLPDAAEQERIANFLDAQTARIDALIAEKVALVEKLSEYIYSQASRLMTRGLDAGATLRKTSFPELGAVPSHWDVKRLKFLGEVRSGVAKGKDIGERATVSLPYLRVANVQDGYVDLTEVHSIEVAEADAQRYLLRKGDVLMNEGGDNDKLGRGAVWQGQVDPCIHQNHVFAVRLDDLELAEWVARFTSTDAARCYFFLRSKQSTNLASINQSNVRELPVPMPPAAERKAILERVRSAAARVDELTQHAKEHIERLREYRSSLISAAVTGQLDVSSYERQPERLVA
jgi:type I restriction enzyme S subunit